MKLTKVQQEAFEKWKMYINRVIRNSGIAYRLSDDGERAIFFRERDKKDLFAKPIRSLILNLTGTPVED